MTSTSGVYQTSQVMCKTNRDLGILIQYCIKCNTTRDLEGNFRRIRIRRGVVKGLDEDGTEVENGEGDEEGGEEENEGEKEKKKRKHGQKRRGGDRNSEIC